MGKDFAAELFESDQMGQFVSEHKKEKLRLKRGIDRDLVGLVGHFPVIAQLGVSASGYFDVDIVFAEPLPKKRQCVFGQIFF